MTVRESAGLRVAGPTLMCPLDGITADTDGDTTVLQARKTVREEEALISLPPSPDRRVAVFPGSFYFEFVRQSLVWLLAGQKPGSVDLVEVRSARYHAMATVGDEVRLRAAVAPPGGGRLTVNAAFHRADGQLLARMTLLFDGGMGVEPTGVIGPAQLVAWIPYGDPLILVDRVVSHEPGKWIHTLKAISMSDPVFRRHADGSPLASYAYPSALAVNSLGQSALLLVKASTETAGMFAGVSARRLVVHRRVYPGDVLRHVVRLDQVMFGNTFFLSGESFVDDELVADGSLVMTVQDPATYLSKMSTPGRRS